MESNVPVGTHPAEDADLAPLSDAQAIDRAHGELGKAAPLVSEQLMETAPAPKRRKTAGEIVFDVGTYGGLSFLGNEALSTTIIQQTKPKGMLQKLYEPSVEFVKKLPLVNKLNYVGEGRAAYMVWATLGGMALVLPVKWMEDRKGELVRKLDNFLHGRNTDEDPHLASAHDEMDRAPKQSWSSLWEGRGVTVASALTMDALIGWPKAPIAKLFDKPGKPNDYITIDRLSATIARKVAMVFDPSKREGIQHVLKTVTDVDKRYNINPAHEGKMAQVVATASVMMSISAALTLLFYGTSKAFAHGHEAKHVRKRTAQQPTPVGTEMRDADSSPTTEPGKNDPSTKVVNVESLSRVAADPLLQAGM